MQNSRFVNEDVNESYLGKKAVQILNTSHNNMQKGRNK
jgi:hypothetical protein